MAAMGDLRFNFVVSRRTEHIADLLRLLEDPVTAAKRTDVFSDGDLTWCLQTYFNLARRGRLQVACTNRIDCEAVNLVHSPTLLEMLPDKRAFVVCIRADFPRRPWAQLHIVQNMDQVGSNSIYLPLWPQSGLQPRDPNRRGVKVVAYVGQVQRNLAGGVELWREIFGRLGIAFFAPSPDSWHDLREIDVLIGIRSLDRSHHSTKPPSKLFNAWHAGIPFIGGNDSAYSQVGSPGTDYLVATTREQAAAHVATLAEDPCLYERLVASGARKAARYTIETISAEWEALLLNAVADRYRAWQASKLAAVQYFTGLGVGYSLHHAKRLTKSVLASRNRVIGRRPDQAAQRPT